MADMPNEQVSLWSAFDQLITKGEAAFFQHNFREALTYWREYARVTGNAQWQNNCIDLENLLSFYNKIDSSQPDNYYQAWLELRQQLHESHIGSYSFYLIEHILARNFLDKKTIISYDLPTGIFCFIEQKIDLAKDNLQSVVNRQPDNYLAKIFLSKCYFAEENERLANALLSQAIFIPDKYFMVADLKSERIRNLYLRLNAIHGKNELALWLAPFELWHRNWLIWIKDVEFFRIMQQKERNERILQVKYYTAEKYRHFIRCLFIAEYVRQFLPKERGIIWEQEAYMEKLDRPLFERYRKKRKPVA
jgi:hypothetical protein